MPIPIDEAKEKLLENLNDEQKEAVQSSKRQLLVVAGAGSGKTEVMARRVVWWVAVDQVPKDQIIAFTFTEAAAEELKFRIREWIEKISADDEEPTLGGMYVGTIHGFCIACLRNLAAEEYYNFDILDEAGRISLIQQGLWPVLALNEFSQAARQERLASGLTDAIELFLRGYDLLNEYNLLDVELSDDPRPLDVSEEKDWCKAARLNLDVGDSETNKCFATSVARYYAYLQARRFLDFSTAQTELVRKLEQEEFTEQLNGKWTRLVVDEAQDINQVQFELIQKIVGDQGHLTAVGDHRQAIYSFRGGRVDLMGQLYASFSADSDSEIVDLKNNYRSTPRIIDISNQWSQTIEDSGGMSNPNMEHGNTSRQDYANEHVAVCKFNNNSQEAEWIAGTINQLITNESDQLVGAKHDTRTEGDRGITYSDVAILLRSATDIRIYQDILRENGIPCVVKGGADLFSQPEVLLFIGALGVAAGTGRFVGQKPNTIPVRVKNALGLSDPEPDQILLAAMSYLRDIGLDIDHNAENRLLKLSSQISKRISGDNVQNSDVNDLKCNSAKTWLLSSRELRRVFPQQIFHWLLEEAGIGDWEYPGGEHLLETIKFHVGQLSTLIKSIETSGWTPPSGFKWQVLALINWGSLRAKIDDSPLLTSPNAVNITTIHASKGLQYPAVFVSDCKSRRFPSQRAKTLVKVPFSGDALNHIDLDHIRDNDNYDDERRLMYVALTRAERYLFITGSNTVSKFVTEELIEQVSSAGGYTEETAPSLTFDHIPSATSRDDRLATSFSDLHYFLECPHDFYLRKVLGYTPTIGQEFGYGRGVHNLLRAVHTSPAEWAEIASDPSKMQQEVERLISRGLFYLRYTTGQPLENLKNKASEGVKEYVQTYQEELQNLEFEPEKEFETLIQGENLLISGAIDVVRLDDPPRVTIIDFKSGDAAEGDSGLTKDMMKLQIGVYALAALHELEYDPEQGLVRYIGENDPNKKQLSVHLEESELNDVRDRVITTARSIRNREFDQGPSPEVPNRCDRCDFKGICSREEAKTRRLFRDLIE